ncbi:MAG: sugar ABC transporter permease [Ignavibacteriaceae bacterium]
MKNSNLLDGSKVPLKLNLRLLSMVIILVVMWVFFRLQVGSFYFSGESFAKLSRDMVSWTILAAGATLIIVSGNIDLSVGSLLALCAATAAILINPDYGLGLSASIAVPIAILVGTLLGAFQGFLTAYFKIPSFIVTLGGFFVFRGMTQKVSAFDPRVPDKSWIVRIGFDYVPQNIGWIIGIAACIIMAFVLLWTSAKKKKLNIETLPLWLTISKIVIFSLIILLFILKVNQYKGLPYQTLVMFVVLVALFIISKNTRFGRYLYAIGGNMQAARLSGIKVERKIVGVFALMGMLAGVAGVVWMAQNQGSTKNAGEFYELYAIAAAVIGGTSLMGGRGTIFGTFLGGLVMATVIQGMDYTSLDNWLQLVVRGSVLVLAVGIDIMTKNPPLWLQQFKYKLSRKNSKA